MIQMNKNQERVLLLISEAKKGYDLYRYSFEELEAGYNNVLHPSVVKSLKSRRKSHITPKVIKAKVRKVMISIMKTYFENDEFAKLVPEYPTDEGFEDVEKLQKALDNWTTKRINLYTRFKPSVIDALVYGTPIVKIYWSGKHLSINRVKIRDLFIDPNATSVFDIQYCVNRVFTTVGRLRSQFGRKFKWKNYVGQTELGTKVSTVDIGDASRVEVHDVYRYQNGKWLVSTVLPDQTFIRTDEVLKDGLPFIIGNIDPQFVGINETNVVEAYGASFIESMIPLQEEYTIIRNQQIDAIDKTFNPQYMATKTSGLNESDLASGRKKVTVSNLSEVEQVPIPRVDVSIFHTDRLDTEMQEVSGVTKASQGIVDNGSKYQTATGMSILSEEGNVVVGDIIRAMNESFFEPAIRRMVRLIYKYDTTPLLYGVDRTKNIKFFVSINAGVGAVNGEILLNNITQAEGSAMQNAKTHVEMQDIEGAKRYLSVLDKLFEEKLKALRLKNIIPTLKGETDEQRPDGDADDEQYEAGNYSEADEAGFGGNVQQQGVQYLPNGDAGAVQQAF
jgi:hypothetical protein